MADKVISRGKGTSNPSGVKTTGQSTNFKGPQYRDQDHYPKSRPSSNPDKGRDWVVG